MTKIQPHLAKKCGFEDEWQQVFIFSRNAAELRSQVMVRASQLALYNYSRLHGTTHRLGAPM